MLREIRDGTVLESESGRSFMNSFNSFYYTFSPDAPDVLTLFSPNSMYLLAKGDTLTFLISWFDFNE